MYVQQVVTSEASTAENVQTQPVWSSREQAVLEFAQAFYQGFNEGSFGKNHGNKPAIVRTQFFNGDQPVDAKYAFSTSRPSHTSVSEGVYGEVNGVGYNRVAVEDATTDVLLRVQANLGKLCKGETAMPGFPNFENMVMELNQQEVDLFGVVTMANDCYMPAS